MVYDRYCANSDRDSIGFFEYLLISLKSTLRSSSVKIEEKKNDEEFAKLVKRDKI